MDDTKRRVKDYTASIYNCVFDWKLASASSNTSFRSVCDSLKEVAALEQADSTTPASLLRSTSSKLEANFELLRLDLQKLSHAPQRLIELEERFNGTRKLMDFRGQLDEPIFNSWPITKFCEYVKELAGSLNREMQFRRRSFEQLISLRNDEAMLFFLQLCWQHSPYFDVSRVDLLLASMLAEVGLEAK